MRLMLCSAGVFLLSSTAYAQPANELTFFSNPGFSGARFTVTGPREILDLPFPARSALIQGGDSWELCAGRSYSVRCETITESQRDLRLAFSSVQSLRPVTQPAYGWSEIARLDVRPNLYSDTAPVRDLRFFAEVKICAERLPVSVRRATVRYAYGHRQTIAVPRTILAGKCSNPVRLSGGERRIESVEFGYVPGISQLLRSTIVVQARVRAPTPPKPQPR